VFVNEEKPSKESLQQYDFIHSVENESYRLPKALNECFAKYYHEQVKDLPLRGELIKK